MAFISLGKADKDLISVLVGCVFSFSSRLIFNYKGTTLFDHPLISNLLASIFRIITVIPYIIFKIRFIKFENNGKKIENNKDIEYIYTNSELIAKKGITKGKYIYIFLSALIYFIQGSLLFFTIKVRMNLYIWNILITCIFCRLIFKIKLFKHHYFSIVLII